MHLSLPEFIVAGWVRAAHGIIGELRVESASDDPNRFSPGGVLYIKERPMHIEWARPHKGYMLLKLDRITSREQAEAFHGTPLEVMVSEIAPLPKGFYYHFQVLGMRVWTDEGFDLGTVTEIVATGSNDVYVVRRGNAEVLIPALSDIINKVDTDKGVIIVTMPLTIQ
jgi:16S rRNA processing protein RimM